MLRSKFLSPFQILCFIPIINGQATCCIAKSRYKTVIYLVRRKEKVTRIGGSQLLKKQINI